MKRKPRKLDPAGFLLSSVMLAVQHHCSIRNQAVLAGLLSGSVISKPGLFKRLNKQAGEFMKQALAAAISWKVGWQMESALPFKRILVQDSSCVGLSAKLAHLFPGAANQMKTGLASLRIQAVYDLLAENFVAFALSSFRRNDQAAAGDLVDLLGPMDLVLRDLGYFTLRSLKQIAAKGAFFLTRLRYGTALFCPRTKEVLDLAKVLRPGQKLDRLVWVGQKEKLPVRLLAFPLPESVANERRRKARANRDKRLNHSNDYMYLLGWSIFITNAGEDLLDHARVEKLYRLRWRIEILFKAWKSHLGLKHLKEVGPRQVEVLVYGLLLFAVLVHHSQASMQSQAMFGRREAVPEVEGSISLLRLAEFLATWMPILMLAAIPPEELQRCLANQLQAHCRYDVRRKRTHYVQERAAVLS